MTIALFMALLAAFSTATSLITEGIKKIFDGSAKTYSANIIATVTACVVGVGGTAAYYIIFAIPFSAANIVCMLLMGVATAVASMTSYDKVVQTIEQMRRGRHG